jgi:hypothetical protein
MIRIVNLATGEVIEREFTAEELAQRQIYEAEELAIHQAKEAKATARAALLNRLGITEDEARLLLA